MIRHKNSVLSDDELLRMLIEHPPLLAVADALVVTRAGEDFLAESPRLRLGGGRPRALAAAVAAAAAVLVVALVSPWSGGASPVEEALAAVGDAPVLHVLIETDEPAASTLVELETGEPIARKTQIEIWFDRERGLKRTVRTLDGRVLDEQLETPSGGLTQGGPIFTCEWIKAHPSEAEAAGVACPDPAAGGGGPTLDAALAEFVDSYRSALASGSARDVGPGRVDGRAVRWLEFTNADALRRVAIDGSTYRPVRAETVGGAGSFRILEAETVVYDASLFAKPRRVVELRGGGVVAERKLDSERAAQRFEGRVMWLGPTWSGLRLDSVLEQERRVTYTGGDAPASVVTLKLTYVPTGGDSRGRIEIYQSSRCLVSIGWSCGPLDPQNELTVGYPLGRSGPALLKKDDVFVSVWGSSELNDRTLDLLRALVPLREGG